LKIAYFINQYPKVSHTFIRREIFALEKQGFDVQRLALRGWAERVPDPVDVAERGRTRYLLREGIGGLILPALRSLARSPARLFSALRLAVSVSRGSDRRLLLHLFRVIEACRLVRLLRESGASRVHAHFGTNSAEVAMYARVLGGPPYSVTIHGPEEFESPMAIGDKVARADFVAAISMYCRSQIYLRSPASQWAKVQVIRCGIDAAFHGAPPVPAPLANRFVCVGRLCEAKGQLLLVEAVARLRAKGIELALVLAGDGDLRAEIESAIDRLGIGAQVRITGWISSERVRDEILAARALVLPSFAEGLPVVIMEAMALRRPVLSTFVAGIPELVVPGETGWLFPAGSLEDLVAALEDCVARSEDDMERLARAGYERVKALHSVDLEAAKLGKLFAGPGLGGPRAEIPGPR
jgi:glycosyltransferase involved in cell wall biosynthesis